MAKRPDPTGFSALHSLGQNVRRTGRLRWAVYSPGRLADARGFGAIRAIFFQFDDSAGISLGFPAVQDEK